VRESRPVGAPNTSNDRVHAGPGRIGTNVTTGPAEFVSSAIAPVPTVTRSQPAMPGSSSGEPPVPGSVKSTSPMRKVVCVHELPCAPKRAGWPTVRFPASMRSEISSAIAVSSTEKIVVPEGRSASTVAGSELPIGCRSPSLSGCWACA
jgi:hypothetical protein